MEEALLFDNVTEHSYLLAILVVVQVVGFFLPMVIFALVYYRKARRGRGQMRPSLEPEVRPGYPASSEDEKRVA
jgi:hypothetical protein